MNMKLSLQYNARFFLEKSYLIQQSNWTKYKNISRCVLKKQKNYIKFINIIV